MAILETQTVVGDVTTTSKSVKLLASSQIWNGLTVLPATLTVSGEASDLTEAMVITAVGYTDGDVTGTSLSLTATGGSVQTDATTVSSASPHTSVTATIATSALETGNYIRVITKLTPNVADDVSEDTLSMIRLGGNGKSSYQVVMTNESHTVPSNLARTVQDFTGSGTKISAYYGVDQLSFTTNATPIFGEFSVGTVTTTGGISSAAGDNDVTVDGVDGSMEDLAGWSGSTDVGARTFNIEMFGINTDPTTTYTKAQSLTRVLEGVQGVQGIQGNQGIQGVVGEKGNRGAGRFSKSLSKAAPEVGSSEFNTDAVSAMVDILGSDSSTPTSIVSGELYRIASVTASDWSSLGGPASAAQGDLFIATATDTDITSFGSVLNITASAPETGDSVTITYTAPTAPSTTLNGSIVAGSHTSVVVVSTDGFSDKGRVTLNGTDVFVYSSKTSVSFVGESQTLGTLTSGDAVVSNSVVVTRHALHDGTGIADNDWTDFTLTVDGSLLVQGTIVSEAIATGAVSASKIETGAVSADKIDVDGSISITNNSGSISGGLTDTTWNNTDDASTINDLLSDNDNSGATSLSAVGDGFWMGNTAQGGRAFIGKSVSGSDASYLKWTGEKLLITGADLVDAAGVPITSGSGLSSSEIHCYQRVTAGAAAPTAMPSIALYYEFSSGLWYTLASGGTQSTNLGNSWETTIPSGSGDLYLVSANASSKQARDAVGTSDWSNIRKFSEVGSGGFNSAPVYAYRRVTAGSSAPTTSPTTDRYYEFASGDWFASSTGGSALSTTIGNDWFTEIPTGSGDVYVVSSTASSANDRDLISSGEWGSIKTLATAGTNGTNGATGAAGTNGTNGATGAAGTNGTNGATGAAGTNGTNGSDAASWYSGSAYSIGDVVSYGASNSSKLYICIVAHSATGTVPTSNTSKWSEFVGVRDVSAGLVQTNSVQTNAITIAESSNQSGALNGAGSVITHTLTNSASTAVDYLVTFGATVNVEVNGGSLGITGHHITVYYDPGDEDGLSSASVVANIGVTSPVQRSVRGVLTQSGSQIYNAIWCQSTSISSGGSGSSSALRVSVAANAAVTFALSITSSGSGGGTLTTTRGFIATVGLKR